jgi:outer membrane protein TolC
MLQRLTTRTAVRIIPGRLCVLRVLLGILLAAPLGVDGVEVSMGLVKRAEDAASGKVLKLDEAIDLALANNPRIKGAEERIKAQEAVLGQQLGAYYPTVTFNNVYRTATASGTTGVSRDAFDFFSTQASATMTLYNFGKREGAVESARDTLAATHFNYKTTVDEVILGVRQAYYGYLQAGALVRVREATVKDRELLVRQARAFYEVGTRPKIDVARAESNLFTAQADLIAAENGVKVAWVTLKNSIGVEDLEQRPLEEDLSIGGVPLSLRQAKEEALSGRPELKSLDAQMRAQDQQVAVARRGHLPDLIFDASYGRRNTSNTGTDTFPLQKVWQAQFSLNIPIFDGFRTTQRVQESLRNYYATKAQEKQQRDQIALEVESSYLRLRETVERIKATEAAERAAKENFDLATGRYQVGVGSIIEVTDAQTLYADAQTNYIRSLYDYKIADAQFHKAIGKR